MLRLLLPLSLGACGGSFAEGAVDLYHDLEGGPIADQRPPPPGALDPYPNLGTTPPRPPATDVAAQQRIADSLAAQRDAATIAASADPLIQPARPPPPKASADPNASSVTVAAAPAPAPATSPNHANPPGLASIAAPADRVAPGLLPDLAAAPPPPPAGFALAGAVPAVAPPPPYAPPPAAPANGVAVAFTPGSSDLPPSASLTLRRFAMAHRGVPLAVTARGDGVLPEIDAQSRAMELALRRAAVIAGALGAAGVPPGNLRLRAEAQGFASAASLLN